METSYAACLFFIDFFLSIQYSATIPQFPAVAFGEITCISETPEQFCELENVARVSIDIAVSPKWVKFQFWVHQPLHLYATSLTCYMYNTCCMFSILKTVLLLMTCALNVS